MVGADRVRADAAGRSAAGIKRAVCDACLAGGNHAWSGARDERSAQALGGYTLRMSTAVSVDEFQALEQRVLRAVEIVKQEREARARAEAEVAALREQLEERTRQAETEGEAARAASEHTQREIEAAKREIEVLNQERSEVRQRVEKLLSQMDELL